MPRAESHGSMMARSMTMQTTAKKTPTRAYVMSFAPINRQREGVASTVGVMVW